MALDRETKITWYGHACVEITTPGGKTVLIDPWFGNPKSPRKPEAVDKCDLMIVTHGHSDHFGDALAIASRTRPAWPAIHELSLWLGRNYAHKDSVIGMNKGGTVEAAGIKVTMTPAEHSAGDIYGTAETPVYLGAPVGVVLELENGYRVYHAGDTAVFGDMRLIGELWKPQLAMLPIGGHFTMGPREAAMAAEWLGVTDVLPIHYGTFPLLAGTPDQLRADLAARGRKDIAVHAIEPGGRLG
ncbi:MAG TPA: metal-dependent hydrolase [Candidatus Limnocylindrales bacterium]|jgi:L-ascorbate metabolism protein UlaG (beta-lactamase superfamily)